MRHLIKWPLLALAFFVGTGGVRCQTGIFFYPALHSSFAHTSIVDVAEAANTEIYLFGKASARDYSAAVPYFGRFDKQGRALEHKFYGDISVWSLNKMTILPSQSVRMYGTSENNGKYSPSTLQITPGGKVEKKIQSSIVYSTIHGDMACKGETVVVVQTKIGENKIYNISVQKINAAKDVVVWELPIVSEQNEEATRVLICADNSVLVLGKQYSANMRSYSPLIYKVSSSGKISWRKNIAVSDNFFTQNIIQVDRSTFAYICSYSKEYLGTSETRLMLLSSSGDPIKNTTVANINANGLVALEGKKVLLYGSNLAILSNRVVTKAKYAIVNKNLEILYQRELGSSDAPDSFMPQRYATILPSTSDFSSATVLKDGRIVLAGKVFMSSDPLSPDPRGRDRSNVPLMVILDENGQGI